MNKKLIIIIGLALMAGIVIGRMFSGGSTDSTSEYVDSNIAQVWTCSMHPQIRQPEAGDCPICGMDLIPVSSETDDGDPMEIRMSKTAMMLAKVQTSLVGQGMGEQAIRLNGKVEVDDREMASTVAHIAGRLEQLVVNFEGETVRKGQLIARVYSPELVTAQRELLEAQKFKDVQPGIFEASKQRLKNWKLTEQQIDDILISQTPLNNFPVYSEQSGTVMKLLVERGDYVKQGQPLFQVTDLSRLWMLFDVYEQDMRAVQKGSEVEFSISSLPGEKFIGKIEFIDPIIDSQTRVAKARVTIPNPRGLLKPEMLATGIVKSGGKKNTDVLTVPKSAVLWTGERSVVYVNIGTADEHRFIMREVTLGPAMGDSYTIVEGLEVGERVVTNGAFHIDAAAQLAGKPSMMDPEGGSTMLGHDHGGAKTPPTKEKVENIKAMKISAEAKVQLQAMVRAYLDMKDALVADDFDTAKVHGEQLKARLEKVDMNLFEGDAHMKWMDIRKALSASTEHTAHFSEITQLREALKPISDNMIVLMKTFDPMDRTIYVEFCPMADDNSGANWLSEEKEILNPYFGASMLKCGKVVQELN